MPALLQTLSACQLLHDLRSMPCGDATSVTDSGDSLSGGQQARISLARTLYGPADIYLLDDVLAALNADVASALLRSVLLGPLCEGAIVILAGNHAGAITAADVVVALCDGEVAAYTVQSPGPMRQLPPWPEVDAAEARIPEPRSQSAQDGQQDHYSSSSSSSCSDLPVSGGAGERAAASGMLSTTMRATYDDAATDSAQLDQQLLPHVAHSDGEEAVQQDEFRSTGHVKHRVYRCVMHAKAAAVHMLPFALRGSVFVQWLVYTLAV
jgi:ABC-type sulfate/molybdate transport systems ATPase subunit